MSFKKTLASVMVLAALTACSNIETSTTAIQEKATEDSTIKNSPESGKLAVYQVFTRLFGNKNTANTPWGTIDENGVGKFSDFTDEALAGIKELGITHVWYTGVPHHAVINDYSSYGISNDDPDVVKGRAGSPYAVKDYYSVNPDLADDPANRDVEFEQLIERTHLHGMKVMIDIVPNHVARHYQSLDNPIEAEDFGASDDTSVEYAKHNNFYYAVNEDFKVPKAKDGYKPLGGEKNVLADDMFIESPAKWTGNGARSAQPDANDWYETVKINYGIKPDGSKDFDVLPEDYRFRSYQEHADFWQGKDVPNSWVKFRDIALYWVDKGVDGFRFDMSEMVPVEFWSYLNSSIKVKNADTFLLAEIYNPKQYRNYIQLGKIDYLYDKVDFYDRTKDVMQGHGSTDSLEQIQNTYSDIEEHLLHFLENHDEQRIASPEFAGSAAKGKPAAVVSTLISRSPTMIYFGQEVGEDGSEDMGFGDPSRTTIFDYAGVPAHQRWMNDGKFDGGKLNDDEAQLRDFYKRLMQVSNHSPAMNGAYASLHQVNRKALTAYDHKQFAFARWQGGEQLIVVSNFEATNNYQYQLQVPAELVSAWNLTKGEYQLTDLLYQTKNTLMVDGAGNAYIDINLAPLQSYVYKVTP